MEAMMNRISAANVLKIATAFCAALVIAAMPFGAPQGARAASAPFVATNNVLYNNPTTVTVYGTVNPNDLPTQAWFEYGLTEGLGSQTSAQSLTGAYAIDTSATLTGLQPTTVYYWRAVAQNSAGRVDGPTRNFTTVGAGGYPSYQTCPGYPNYQYPNCPVYQYPTYPTYPYSIPPTVNTRPATANTDTSLTFYGTVNPNGSPTSAWFEYGVAEGNLARLTARDVGSGFGEAPRTTQVIGLRSGTTYHYRLVAQNSYGITYGSILSASTTGAAPSTGGTGNTGGTGGTGAQPTSTAPGAGATSTPVIVATAAFGEESVGAGNRVTYTLTVRNAGSAVANNVSATLTLPNELAYVKSDPNLSSRNDADYIFALGSLEPNDEKKLEVTLKASGDLAQEIVVQVAASIDYTDAANKRQVVTSSRTVRIAKKEGSFFANIGSAFGRLGNVPGYIWFFVFLLVAIIAVTWFFFAKLRGTEPAYHEERGEEHSEERGSRDEHL